MADNDKRINTKLRGEIDNININIVNINKILALSANNFDNFQKNVFEKIDKLESKIYGNGKAGALERIQRLEDFQENKKENKDVFFKVATVVLGLFSLSLTFIK